MNNESRHLARHIRFHQLFTLAFGTIVGVGWIIVMSTWLIEGGVAGASVAFIVAGVFMSAVGVCYARLAVLYPVTGGAIAYGYHVYGSKASFVIGWFMVLIYVAASAFAVISTSWLIEALFPVVKGPALYSVMGSDINLGTLLVGLASLAVIAAMNYRGADFMAGLQDFLTLGLVAVGISVIACGVAGGQGANLTPLFKSAEPGEAFRGFLAVLVTTPFFLAGFEVIPQAMGERHEDVGSRQVLVAVVGAILLAAAFYVAAIIGTAMLLPRQDFSHMDLAVAEAFSASFSPFIGKLVLVCGLFGVLSSWNALFFAGTRILYALGRAHFLPSVLGDLCPKHGTPSKAILLVAATGVIVVLFGKAIILPIVKTHVTVISAVFCSMSIAVLVLQARGKLGWKSRVTERLIPVSAALFSAFMVVVALYQANEAKSAVIPVEWVILFLWSMLGVFAWRWGAGHRAALPESLRAAILTNG